MQKVLDKNANRMRKCFQFDNFATSPLQCVSLRDLKN